MFSWIISHLRSSYVHTIPGLQTLTFRPHLLYTGDSHLNATISHFNSWISYLFASQDLLELFFASQSIPSLNMSFAFRTVIPTALLYSDLFHANTLLRAVAICQPLNALSDTSACVLYCQPTQRYCLKFLNKGTFFFSIQRFLLFWLQFLQQSHFLLLHLFTFEVLVSRTLPEC